MTAFSLSSAVGALPLGVATPDEAAEAALLHAAQGGCQEAFRTLVEEHQQRVYHFCFHYLRDVGDAREACQDTFIRAHGALDRYRRRARVSTWLFQIALNLCRDRFRQRPATRGRQLLALEDHEVACHRPSPDEAAMRGTDLAKLDRGLNALPEKFRAVIVLSCLDGLSHGACAAILKCSERAVEGRLYRARQRLEVWWQRETS
ncbi:RNA polymerase sigma factor [Luteolibacter arcticus]|uniref:RNA polymerase sigma factor n=1 Tax=Luteolibacter arcticus TaxID=1581411 RepID=A0ABT3GI22_9BACT|nr:RNA polymerase sigma factor [Luteolibacter arcticus]MCW1923144.1 RNA polymerase sigma factor [Luteolibacter arcticus]